MIVKKINIHPLGDFTISFSTEKGTFFISKSPECLDDKPISIKKQFKTWDEINLYLYDIKEKYIFEYKLLRKVIIIQLQTSISDFHLMKSQIMNNELESVLTDDHLYNGVGFKIKWFIGEEYEYPKNNIVYKLIEAHTNCRTYTTENI